ncbi:MAG: hypothetical protein EA398_16225 [Deltaproteobacteria bacterium]|nr:MAG: hypothetical protein EA398_16225 [Deltaproteobacteria bacterium]
MRVAALADLHLGFRAFSAKSEGTRRNLREVDVERTWERVVDQVVAEDPDLVTIAGDVFHHPRVSDYARRALLRGLNRIRCDVVILQGNHDAGKTGEVLTPVALARELAGGTRRIHVATEVERVVLASGIAVTCVPYVDLSVGRNYRLRPDPAAKYNVLLVHAAARSSADGSGKLPYFYGAEDKSLDVGKHADDWDAILLGDYHEYTMLHPTRPVFYSGSIDRTSSNIWQENRSKGWVLVDLEALTHEFRKVETRPMWDYIIDGDSAEEVNLAVADIAYTAEASDEEPPLVRLRVDDFPRHEKRLIDWSAVNALKRTVAHFYLDLRYRPLEVAGLEDGREAGERVTLESEARAYFKDAPDAVRALVFEELGLRRGA